MSQVPYIEVNENTEPVYAQPRGGRVILVIGKTPETKDLTNLITIYTPADALKGYSEGGLGPVDDDNELLDAVLKIFEENKKRDASDQIGVEKIYAVNIGLTPSASDWEDAAILSEQAKDIEEELYVLCSDLAVMNTIKTRLETLATVGQYRIAGFTHEDGATVEQIAAMTDPGEVSYVSSTRIWIKDNPTMQSYYAGKSAHTEPHMDPSFTGYRAVEYDTIREYQRSDEDLDTLVSSGIIPDMERIGFPGEAEPCRAVSTAFREVDGEIPVDANLHIRRNVDYIWRELDKIVSQQLKNNDTAITLEVMKEAGRAFLNQQLKDGKIQEYEFDVIPDTEDPYMVVVQRGVRPQNAIYFIREDSTIKAPQ